MPRFSYYWRQNRERERQEQAKRFPGPVDPATGNYSTPAKPHPEWERRKRSKDRRANYHDKQP